MTDDIPIIAQPLPKVTTGRWVSTAEAAHLLGLSDRTIRRHIEAGKLKGERGEGEHALRVWIEGAETEDGAGEPTGEPTDAGGASAEAEAGATGQGSDQLPAVPSDAISWVLADHLTELTRANAELVKRIEQLAIENGGYKERIRVYEEQATALPAGDVPPWRPWWKRLLGIE